MNTGKWEKEHKEREQKREKIVQEWEKKTRFEKIKHLMEKLREKMMGEQEQLKESTTPMREERRVWQMWRHEENNRSEGTR